MRSAVFAVFVMVSNVAVGSMVVTSTTTIPLASVPSNAFATRLAAEGVDTLATVDSEVDFSTAGTLDLSYVAAESGFNNTFKIGTLSYTETDSNVDLFDTPIPIGSISVSAGDTLTSLGALFDSGGFTPASDAFGIYFDSTKAHQSVVYLSFDDGGGRKPDGTIDDDNHDDMIIAARFRPVPEPSTIAVWVLLGLCGSVAARCQRRAKRD